MKLTLLKRLVIINSLPEKGSFEYLTVRKDLVKKVEVTQDEVAKYEIKTAENGHLQWKQNDDTIEVELTELEKKELARVLKDLSDKGDAADVHLELYNEVK